MMVNARVHAASEASRARNDVLGTDVTEGGIGEERAGN